MAGSTGRKISTFIELGGEQAFKQALSDASRQVRVMDADLKAVASEFKSTGDAQQYFSQKTELLKSKIAEQERYVDMLKAGVKAAAGTYGEASSQADGYRIKLSNATARLYDMRRELEAADREAEEFGRDSAKVGRQIENGIVDGAEEAQQSVKNLIEQMKEDIGSIRGSAAYSVASQIGSQVVEVVQGVSEFVTSNREYRRQLSFLKTAAQSAGYDWEQIIKLNNEIAAFTGDMDGATEATSNLLKTGLDQEWIQTAVTMFEGASVIWQETLKMENLAESFQETVATGEGTGAFAELVERLGLDLDGIKAVLEDAETLEEKAKAALTYISSNGLTQAAEGYLDQNKELYDAQLAQVELEQAWAELAAELEPFVIGFTESMTWAVNQMTDAIKGIKQKGFFGWLFGVSDTGNSDLYMPDGRLNPEVAAAWGLTEREARKYTGDTGPIRKNFEVIRAEAKEEAEEWVDAYVKELEEGRPTVQDVMNAYWQTMGTENDPEEVAKSMISKMQPKEEEIAELRERFASIGVDAASLFDTSFGAAMDTAASNAEISGQNAGVSLGNGLNTGLAGACDVATTWVNQINTVLGSIGQGLSYAPVYGGVGGSIGGSSSGSILINNTLKIDGKTIYKSADTYAGRKASRLG